MSENVKKIMSKHHTEIVQNNSPKKNMKHIYHCGILLINLHLSSQHQQTCFCTLMLNILL